MAAFALPGGPQTRLEVVRMDDPAYKRPLLIGTTACELTTDVIRTAYAHRWPVETNFLCRPRDLCDGNAAVKLDYSQS